MRSGNTGPSLLEPDQPFFVYAFILLPSETVGTLANEVKHLYEEEGISAKDLKASQLWKSSRGLRRYERIGTLLVQMGTSLCLSIIEKRYQACALIVETFLDPAYNPSAPPQAAAAPYRQWLAQQLYASLEDRVLHRFLTAQREDDITGMRIVGEEIANRLALHPDDQVVDAAQRIMVGLNDFYRFGKQYPDFPTNFHRPAAQQAAFFPSLMCVEALLQSLAVQAMLICDEDRQFGEVLTAIFGHACTLEENPFSWEFGDHHSLTHIIGMKQADSSDSFGIQLADLAAGLVNRVAILSVKKSPLTALQQRVVASWRLIFAPLASHGFMLADVPRERIVRTLFAE